MWLLLDLRRRFIACFAFCIANVACYGADRTDVSVSDGYGQTLVFYGDEVAPPRLGKPKRSVLYMYDPVRDKAPRAVAASDEKLPTPVAIANRHVLVLADGLLNAQTGKRTPFLDTGSTTKVLAVREGKVVFVEELAHAWFDDLDTSDPKRTTIRNHRRGRYRLHVVDTTRGYEAVPLTTLEIEEVVGKSDDCLWVVGSGKPRHLYRVPLEADAVPEQVMPIDDQWATFATSCTASPTGRYLAIASLDGQRDVHSERVMCVFDRKQRKAIHFRNDVPHRQIGCNISPLYLIEWLDDDILRYGLFEAAAFDVSTGKHVVGDEASALIERTEARDTKQRDTVVRSLQSTMDGRLFFRGDFEPIAVSPQFNPYVWLNGDYAVSADGDWAVVDVPGDDRVYLIDGKARTRTVLQEGRGWGFEWLTPGVVGREYVRYSTEP